MKFDLIQSSQPTMLIYHTELMMKKSNSPMVDLCFQMKSITIGSLVPYVLNVWLIPITYLARQRGVESGSHCTKSLWAHNWNLVKIIFLIMMS